MIMEFSYDHFYSDNLFGCKTNIFLDQSCNITLNSSDPITSSEINYYFENKNSRKNLVDVPTNQAKSEFNRTQQIFTISNKKKSKIDLKQTRSRRNQRFAKTSLEDLVLELLKENYCQQCKLKIEKYFKVKKLVEHDNYDKVHYKENNRDARILTEPSKKKGALAIKQGVSKTFLELVNKKILIVFAFTFLAILCMVTIMTLLGTYNGNYSNEKSDRLLVSHAGILDITNSLSFLHFENQILENLKTLVLYKIKNKNSSLIEIEHNIENFPYSQGDEELIIQHRILFELMIGDAPFLQPKEFFNKMKFICFWDIFIDNETAKSDFSFLECGHQFLRKYYSSKDKLFNLLKENLIDYSDYLSFPAGVKNVLIYMSYMDMTVGWDIRDFLHFLKVKDFFSAAQKLRITFWGKNYDRQVYYNSFLIENGINSMIPSFLAEIKNYIEIYPIKFENSYVTYNFFICYKALIEMTLFETDSSEKENILNYKELVNLEEYNPLSIFYKHGKFKYIYEQIYHAYYSKYKLEISKILYVKELMERIFFLRKMKDLELLHDYVKTLNIKSEL
jgi:hypothetical protein